jgi:hypothetical protein
VLRSFDKPEYFGLTPPVSAKADILGKIRET